MTSEINDFYITLEAHLAFVSKLNGVNVIGLQVIDQRDLLVAGPGGRRQLHWLQSALKLQSRLVLKLERISGAHLSDHKLNQLLPFHARTAVVPLCQDNLSKELVQLHFPLLLLRLQVLLLHIVHNHLPHFLSCQSSSLANV